MGLKGAYSFHSMSGGWSGDQKPGEERESAKEERECEECGEKKKSTSEREGDFKGQMLCKECLTKLQEEKEEDEKRAVLDRIRNGGAD